MGQGQPKAKQLAVALSKWVALSPQDSRNASGQREQKATDPSSKNQGRGNVPSKDVQDTRLRSERPGMLIQTTTGGRVPACCVFWNQTSSPILHSHMQKGSRHRMWIRLKRF